MRSNLRLRLTLWYVVVLAAVLVAFSVGIYALLSKSLHQRMEAGLRSAVDVTSLALNHETEEHLGRTEGEENFRLVLNTMYETSFPRPNISVWRDTELVAEKPGVAALTAQTVATHLASLKDVNGYAYKTLEVKGLRYRLAVKSAWVAYSQTRYLIVSNEALAPLESEMRSVSEILFGTVPACILLAALGGYFLARKSLAPVLGMARTADHITSMNLDERLPVQDSHDELGLLAESFNRVLDRLQESFRQQRQFMADASHELRTPMSVALIATQVSLEGSNKAPEALVDTLEVVQAQMLRLRSVVEGMFTLAQADSGVFQTTTTTFYLDEVLQESVRAGKVLGTARGIDVKVAQVSSEAEYSGDEGLLRQLLLILIDNGVKYTGADGQVEVSLVKSGGSYRIRVADTGPGVPSADQPYIFDRFYRADKARSRRQPGAGGGAGLGLAIGLWITQLHAGRLYLERSDSGGSVFCVELPVSR